MAKQQNTQHVNQDQIANKTPPMLYGCFFNRKAEDNINVTRDVCKTLTSRRF